MGEGITKEGMKQMQKPVVVLDPGHGGYDSGAAYNGLKEKDLNLALAVKVASRLDGVRTLLTRERDTYVSLADRVALSRRAEADLFLSLHANAGGGQGFESFIYSGLGAKDPTVAMQKTIHKSIINALGRWEVVDRGLKQAGFYVLKSNPRPAVLVESLFLDNLREARIWREPLFTETLATGLVEGIRAALGLAENEEAFLPDRKDPAVIFTPPASKEVYTVQVGAFAYLENARQRLAEAQAAGFKDAYIYQKQ
jgi:N-acetylmuramoyl-L-alanine amidase